MDKEKIVHAVVSAGVAKAVLITQDRIVLSEDFRRICETNQCGGYGRCWMCPPYIGEVSVLMEKVRSYPMAVLYQTIHEIEDSFDIEGMFEAGKHHAHISVNVEENVRQTGSVAYLHLSCGGCHICETCAKRFDEPCRYPGKALASLEGYGVDVYNTTKGTPLKYINGQNTVTYFGMVLFKE